MKYKRKKKKNMTRKIFSVYHKKKLTKTTGKETFSDNTCNVINRLNIKQDLHQDMKRRVISLPNENYMISMMICIE